MYPKDVHNSRMVSVHNVIKIIMDIISYISFAETMKFHLN